MQNEDRKQKEQSGNNDKTLWLFFDYSGTLVDTVKALSKTYSRYLQREFSEQNVKDFYKDYPRTNKLKLMLKYKMNPFKFIFGGKQKWEEYRQEEFWKQVKAFPGIADVLNKFGKNPTVKMAIVTHETELNNPVKREKILKNFEVPNVFAAVVTDYSNKEKSFSNFIEENKITTGVFVGDTQFDIGKRQNCETIGVTWGFSTKDEFRADHIASNPKELEKIIIRWIHQLEQEILHGDPI